MNDKVQHALAGAAAALLGALIYALIALALLAVTPLELKTVSIVPVPFIAALVAGLTKEAADWFDNRTTPGTHTVDPWDVAATVAPGLVISIALAFAVL